MKLTNQQEAGALQVYHLYWDSYTKGNLETFASTLDEDFEMIGTSESEVCHNKADGLEFYQAQMQEVVGKAEMKNRIISAKLLNDMVLVNETCDVYVLGEPDWTFYSKLRLSTLLHETESGWKVIQQHGSLPDMRVQEGETLAIEKISKENLELRDAVKRRTIELENKSKELEIEASLERVRAVAMGMNKPSDMLYICRIISEQLQLFGVTQIRNIQTAIIDEEKGIYLCYQYFTAYDKEVVERTEYLKSPVENGMVRQMLASRDGHFTGILGGKELVKFRQHRKDENHFPDPLLDETEEISHCFLSIGQGGLGLTLYQPLDGKTLDLFKRFHQVFSLAYSRFRDIEKAEARAREVEIDLALERVRAQTMAMHSSEDVGKCIVKMFDELTALGVDEGTRFGIGILNHENENNQLWTARKDGEEVKMHIGNLDMSSHPLLKSARRAWKAQTPFHKYVLEGKDLLDYYQMLNQAPDYKIRIPIEKLPKREVQHCFIFEHGFFYAFSPQEFQSELIHIIHRFSSQFAQTYRRYLDLVKAEGQAREAEIELALERVRARSMAMHKSEELKEVIQVIFDQLSVLKINAEHAGIVVDFEPKKDWNFWVAETQDIPSRVSVPYLDSSWDRQYTDAKKKGKEFFTTHLSFEEKNSFYEKLLDYIPELTDKARDFYFSCPGLAISTVVQDDIGVYIENFSGTPYTTEENAILIRFGKVFQQTYTRFLDLKKAEAQTREAQINLAVERVRAKALAMFKSTEIMDVVFKLKEEIMSLDIPGVAAASILLKEKNGLFRNWDLTSYEQQGDIMHITSDIIFDLYSTHPDFYLRKVWSEGEKYTVVVQDLDSLLISTNWLRENNKVKEANEAEEFIKSIGLQKAYHPTIPLNNGRMCIDLLEPPAVEIESILKKMGAAFDLAYTRFLDLQKAEGQAREAQIEAALERVRARTMAMQRSEELNETAQLLFQQIKSLGVPPWSCGFNIWEQGDTVFTSYMSGTEGVILPAYKIPLTEEATFIHFQESRDRSDKLFVDVLQGETIETHYDYFQTLPGIRAVFEKRAEAGFPLPTFQINHLANFSYGNLMFITYEPCPEAHDIFIRFAAVFEQTYTRFLDLQKAEAQAREAQIEASLERVRSRSLAMHNTSELQDVIHSVHNELLHLNIGIDGGSFIAINSDIKTTLRCWGAGGTADTTEEIYIPLYPKPFCTNIINSIKKGSGFFTEAFTQKDKKDFFTFLFKHEPWSKLNAKQKKDTLSSPGGYTRSCCVSLHTSIFIINHHGEIFSAADNDILKRFAKVFEQTYTRFLDIQKAEAQAREAQIELALERVRARTMAMQVSDELAETAALLFKQLSDLDIKTWTSGFNIWENEDTSFIGYNPTPSGGITAPYHIPSTEDSYFLKIREAKKRGEEFIVFESAGQSLEATYDYMKTLPVVKDVLKGIEAAGFQLPEFQINHCIYFRQGFLLFITLEHYPEAHDIFKKFGKLFEQTYTRFLDLQKAEAQARESQIQLALERVRARTMAMQHSEELNDVATILFNQLRTLGGSLWTCAIVLCRENSNEDEFRTAFENGVQPSVFVPNNVDDVHIKMYQGWKRKNELFSTSKDGEALKVHYRYMMTVPSTKTVFENMLASGIHFPSWQKWYAAYFSAGYLMIITTGPYYDEQIFVRFAKVFDQAYTRFLDLQKAEAQAREAKIEASLERVRSRALGMQSSDELAAAAQLLYSEFAKLGINTFTCGYMFIDEEKNSQTAWVVLPDGTLLPNSVEFPLTGDHVLDSRYKDWKDKKSFHVLELNGDENKKHHQFLLTHVQGIVAEEIFSNMPERIIFHCANFSNGYLLILAEEFFTAEEEQAVIRFANVFEMTYTRFLDLQKAEAQAREAQIELALERVRARTMAMQRSEELPETAEILFQQFALLGGIPDRIRIGIVREDNEVIEWWVTDQLGSQVTRKFDAPLHQKTHAKWYKAWKEKKESLVVDLTGSDLDEWIRFVRDDLKMPLDASHIITRRVHHAAFFSQGLLLCSAQDLLQQETFNLLVRFAKVFEQTYTRFLDLQKAEAQAREAQIEAALERVRSKTMAMHSSEDVDITVSTLFNELLKLGVEKSIRSGIGILNLSRIMEVWTASTNKSGETSLDKGILDMSKHSLLAEIQNGWEAKKETHTYELVDDDLISYFQAINNAPDYSFQVDLAKLPEKIIHYDFYFPEGVLFVFSPTPLSEELFNVFKRFTGVFGQTYRRFLDLQKAEAQAKEAQIETAVERVRAQSMAMHRTDDLHKVTEELLNQLKKLNVDGLTGTTIYLVDDNDIVTAWDLSSPGNIGTPGSYTVTYDAKKYPVNGGWVKTWRTSEQNYFALEFPKEVLLKAVEEWKEIHPEIAEIIINAIDSGKLTHQWSPAGRLSKGLLAVDLTKPPTEDTKNIVTKMAGAFNLAYQRFEDLQKAEAQAREAEIELVLERVRSRTMAMQKSDELTDVASLLFEQVGALGIKPWTAGFNVWSEDNNSYVDYITSPNGGFIEPYTVHTDRAEALRDISDARKSGVEFDVQYVKGEKIKQLYRALSGLGEKQFEIMLQDGNQFPSQQYEHFVFGSKVSLMFITYEPVPEVHDVFKRLGKVFEQTYTRFLDLKKAESQAREAQIEAALERIRARAMAMHHSGELRDVLTVLFNQFDILGIKPVQAQLSLFDLENNRFTFRSTGKGGRGNMGEQIIDMDAMDTWKETIDTWKASKPKSISTVYFPKETLPQLWALFDELRNQLPEEDIITQEDFPDGVYVTEGNFNYGYIGFSHNRKATTEEEDIVIKIATEFGRLYQRFLDLQKAEAQAREAQIENALEKVRSRTMAMQHSDELTDVAGLLFNQVSALGIKTWTAGFNVWSEDNNSYVDYLSLNGEFIDPYTVQTETAEALKDLSNARKSGVEFEVLYVEGEKNKQLYLALSGIDENQLEIMLKDGLLPAQQYEHFVFGSKVSVMFITYEPVPEAHEIFKRLGKVFEQTYTRFLDLQKAEEQAREAEIELALERVRARTMAMQRSEELLDVATVLFQQVKGLGVPQWNCGFNIWEIGDQAFTYYPGTPDGVINPSPCKIPLNEHPVFRRFDESRKNGLELLVYEKEGEEQKDHYRYMLSLPGVGDLLQSMLDVGFELPTFQIDHLANFAYGNLIFITYEHFPEMHQVFKRFAKVFEQTYTRFIDLQKAEASAREAKIEAALEKVRSRTMGMQHSDELPEAANLLFLEVQALGIPSWSAGYNILQKDNNSATCWMSSEGMLQKPFQLRLWGETSFDEMGDFVRSDKTMLVQELGDKAIDEHYAHMKSFPDLKPTFDFIDEKGLSLPTYQINHLCKFTQGFLLFITYEKVPEAHDIFRRFTKVFEQTYTRFLDLQKAEAQAREAKIEVALEKVRSRTMGMQKADELGAVATVLFRELNSLVTNLWTCGFVLCKNGRQEDEWWLSLDNGLIQPFFLPNVGDFAHKTLYEGWQKGDSYRTVTLENKELSDHYDWLMNIPISKKIFEEMEGSGIPRPAWQRLHAAYFKTGYLVIITEMPCEEEEIFKRFAQVFDLTYTRFLDLKKAEAQAREAQIEAALERIRSRTMAMQKSDELTEVAGLLFEQVSALGIKTWTAGFNVWSDDNNSYVDYITSPNGGFIEPYTVYTERAKALGDISNARKSGVEFDVLYVEGEKIKQLYRALTGLGEKQFEKMLQDGVQFPSHQYEHFVFGSKVSLMFITYEPVPEAHDIFKRLGKVFEQTYTRFLDLQKAETQARESQIEVALEKVRSRSLAMQNPEELIEVAQLLREEMGSLGVEELETSSIYIHDESSGSTQCWFTIKNSLDPPTAISDQMNLNLQDTWVGRQMLEFSKSDQDKTSILMQGDQRIEWIHYCEDKSELLGKSEFYGDTIPERTYHLYKFPNGFLGAASPGPISEASWDLLRRATAVFSFAYTRFQDLQMAQSSARTALRQASLDRVRADISSMRNAADLERVTPLIFNELNTLGIPFIRCGVFIIREKQEIVEAYLSSPDGKSLGVLKLAYQASDLTFQTVVAWRKGVVYRQHWDKEDFVRWIKQLMEQDQIQDSTTYQGAAAPPESLDLHFVPFTQGMLYVGAEIPLDENEIDLVQSLAKAFSIAFARYEDFVKLEQAKAEVESAMSELKATQSQLIQQEKLASLGQLTAGIAHEIKNPLNFVNNFSEVSIELIDEAMEERAKTQETRDETLISEILADIRSNIEKVHEHGTRADRIVKSMLQHSRSGDNKKAFKPLNPIIKEFVNLAYHGMRASKLPIDVAIDLQLSDEIGEVELIAEDFSRVILNLCNNGFDAMREKLLKTEDGSKKTGDGRPETEEKSGKYEPRLIVSSKLENGKVLISFEDNGSGIPDEIKDKIMQPFFTTKKGTEGTGLGLSITHDIVKAHGGELKVESTLGEGSIFSITIPIN